MRKNIGDSKRVVLPVKSTYLVSGSNHQIFLNRLKKNQITVYSAKKRGKKQLIITINNKENQKLFAITKELCYNIKKIKDGGRFYPLLYLTRNIGVFIGAILFCVGIYLSSDRIYKVNFAGSGSVYQAEVQEILTDYGVKPYARFSSFDLKKLSHDLLRESDRFSFVGIEKHGNTLRVELVLSTLPPSSLQVDETATYSKYSGVIESIKLYRGTSLVSEGDFVKVGDPLVSAYYQNGGTIVNTGALAVITIIGEEEFSINAKFEDPDIAVAMAVELLDCGEVVGYTATCQKQNEEYVYTVKLRVRYVVKSGN